MVGVHTKDIAYDRYPRMPDTSWAERAYSSGALDPSLGQAFAFPSLLQLRLRIEVPLWRDLTTAKHSTADLPAEEDSASDATGSAERSPRLALPVPVGLAEPPEDGAEEATDARLANSAWQFRAREHRSRRRSSSSVADLRAAGCHVPHRVESAVSPPYADQSPWCCPQ